MPDERSIEELVEWRRTACPECGDARGWSIRPHRGTGDPEQVECQACAEFNTLLRAVARLREERDEARAKLKGTLMTLRLAREHEKPHTPSPYDAGYRRPHPEGRGP